VHYPFIFSIPIKIRLLDVEYYLSSILYHCDQKYPNTIGFKNGAQNLTMPRIIPCRNDKNSVCMALVSGHVCVHKWSCDWLYSNMPPGHREEIYREVTRGKLCHADIFSLLTIENYINSLFY
jgi:hypothetical protein